MLQGSIDIADEYLGSQNEYIRFLGRARAYWPIFWDIVLKFNLEMGYIANWNAPNKEVPIFERFFVGGPNSVRGFSRSSLGPSRAYTSNLTDPSSTITNFEIGGNKEIVFNAELEIPILKAMNISGVVFFDMGNAYNEDQDPQNRLVRQIRRRTRLRHAILHGLRLPMALPHGPTALRMGLPIEPQKERR